MNINVGILPLSHSVLVWGIYITLPIRILCNVKTRNLQVPLQAHGTLLCLFIPLANLRHVLCTVR